MGCVMGCVMGCGLRALKPTLWTDDRCWQTRRVTDASRYALELELLSTRSALRRALEEDGPEKLEGRDEGRKRKRVSSSVSWDERFQQLVEYKVWFTWEV